MKQKNKSKLETGLKFQSILFLFAFITVVVAVEVYYLDFLKTTKGWAVLSVLILVILCLAILQLTVFLYSILQLVGAIVRKTRFSDLPIANYVPKYILGFAGTVTLTVFLLITFILGDTPETTDSADTYREWQYNELDGGGAMGDEINLTDATLSKDTIEIYEPDIATTHLQIITPDKYQIKKAERILYWYPCVWSNIEDELLQFITVQDLLFPTTEKLQILSPTEAEEKTFESGTYNNIIAFNHPIENDYDLSFFRSISTAQLKQGVIKTLEQQGINDKREKSKWMSYLELYKKGEFDPNSMRGGEMFDVSYMDVYIRITLEGKKGDIVRVLHWKHIIGN